MKNLITTMLIVLGIGSIVTAQERPGSKTSSTTVPAKNETVVGKADDGSPVVTLSTVNINDKVFESSIDKAKYYRLKYNVEKVYPYAAQALGLLDDIDDANEEIDKKRKQKKYRKNLEKELKGRFKKELRNLTVTQGRILVEIIEKETGEPFYNLLTDLKSPISARFYNTMAKKYGYSLKEGYNPDAFPYFEEVIEETKRKLKS